MDNGLREWWTQLQNLRKKVKTIDKFEIKETDTRLKLIDAFENKKDYFAQRLDGKAVELFDDDYGFYLKNDIIKVSHKKVTTRRAYAIAKLTQRFPVRLALREMYYIIRTNSEYDQYFKGISNTKYADEFNDRVNTLEILADLDRINFTISTGSKGYFHYPFNRHYSDVRRKVLFSEELGFEVIQESELTNCQSILICEKEAATNRLLELGFAKLTNMAISTVQGTFNRAVFRFTKRFNDVFPLIYFADGDIYGSKMLSLIGFGSKRSRHLNLRNIGSEKIFIAGLFPSVGEDIGLENDKEQKRPLASEQNRAMLAHLKQFNLVDESDVETWERNKTFELEALSTTFINSNKEPVGLAIYLIEYMRLNKVPVKPMPLDNELQNFLDGFNEKIEDDLFPIPDREFVTDHLRNFETKIDELFDKISIPLRDQALIDHQEKIEKYLEEIDSETIKNQLISQYCQDMELEIYDLDEIVQNSVNYAYTNIDYDNDELIKEIETDVKEAMDKLFDLIKPKIEKLVDECKVSSDLELNEISKMKACNLYDKVLTVLTVKEEDKLLIREALEKRLNIKYEESEEIEETEDEQEDDYEEDYSDYDDSFRFGVIESRPNSISYDYKGTILSDTLEDREEAKRIEEMCEKLRIAYRIYTDLKNTCYDDIIEIINKDFHINAKEDSDIDLEPEVFVNFYELYELFEELELNHHQIIGYFRRK